jgi:hypothetical protein
MQQRITLPASATFENDLKPIIVDQLNQTASMFYYDVDRYQRLAKQHGMAPRTDVPQNVIVGKNQRPGLCHDYSAHFIENFRGPGDLYLVNTDVSGNTKLFQRIKRFEKSDILVTPQTKNFIDTYYQAVLTKHNEISKAESKWGWSFGQSSGDLVIGPYLFNSNTDGSLYLLSEQIVPAKPTHAGKTDFRDYTNHAWVRIIWNGLAIDVEPTWYDNGQLLEFGIIEVVTGKPITYPSVSGVYRGLPNTTLISPFENPVRVGSDYRFVISSTDFTEIALNHDDKWHYLTRNKNNPRFGIIFTIPANVSKIMLCGINGAGNNRAAKGLVSFDVVGC